MSLNPQEQRALTRLTQLAQWVDAVQGLEEASQQRVFWAANQQNIHIGRLIEPVQAFGALGDVEQRVHLLGRVYKEHYCDYHTKWYPEAHALIRSLVRDAPHVFQDGSVALPQEAASRRQIDAAAVQEGRATPAFDDEALTALASAALENGPGGELIAQVLAQLPEGYAVVDAFCAATQDERIYTWHRVAPCLEGASAAQAIELAPRISDAEHARSATLALLRPHAAAAIAALEEPMLAYEVRCTYASLFLALVTLRRQLGMPVSDQLAQEFIKWDINTSGVHEPELTRAAMESFDLAWRRDALRQSVGRTRANFLMDLGQEPSLVAQALLSLNSVAVDHYTVKQTVEAFSGLDPDFALPPLLQAMGQKPKKGAAAAGISTLGAWGDPRGVETLLAFSGASGKTNKVLADQALEAIGERGLEALVAALTHKKKAVRTAAGAQLLHLAQQGVDASALLAPALDQIKDKALRQSLEPLTQGPVEHQRTPLEAAREACGADTLRELTDLFAQNRWKDPYKRHPAFADHPVEACLALLDAFKYNDNSYHHRAALNLERTDTELSAWVLAEILRHMPPKTRTWNLKPLLQTARKKGAAMLAPALHALEAGMGAYGEHLLDVVARHGGPEHTPHLVAGLSAPGKAARDRAVELLGAAPAAHLSTVLELLTSRKKDIRAAAARVCRENPIPNSAAALQAALDKERSADVQAVLSAALARVTPQAAVSQDTAQDTAQSSLDPVTVAQECEAARGRLPKFIDLASLPSLRFQDGTEASPETRGGLILKLKQESASFHDDRLDALAQAFDQGDLDAFGRGLYSAWGKAGHKANAKWAVFQLSVTSSRDTLARLVDDLNRMASGGRHALAGWLLLVCARHRSPDGPAWNHHWANAALTRGTRNKAREARAYAAERRGWTLDQLKATVDTFILDTVADRALLADPNATPAQLEGRFIQQAAMQRPYTVQALRDGFLAHPGLGAAFASVLWRAEDGRLLTCGQDSAALLDGEEVDLKPEDRLCLVHPAELDPESLDQWRARLCPQPLTQLDREVVRADLSGNKSLKLSASPMTGSAMASALHRSGFHSDAPEDAGWVYGASLRFAPVELTGRMDHGGFVVSSPGFGKKPIHVESAYFTPIEGRDLAALDQVPAGVISEFALALRPFGVTVL